MNNVLREIASLKAMLKKIITSNQLRRIIVQDKANATISIKVYDGAGKLRVMIGKRD